MKTNIIIVGIVTRTMLAPRTSAYEAALKRANELKDHAVAMARDAWRNVTSKEEFPADLIVPGDTIEIIFTDKVRHDRSFSGDGPALVTRITSNTISFKLTQCRIHTGVITVDRKNFSCRLLKAA